MNLIKLAMATSVGAALGVAGTFLYAVGASSLAAEQRRSTEPRLVDPIDPVPAVLRSPKNRQATPLREDLEEATLRG